MTRIATARRTTSAIAAPPRDPKPKARVPLSRISNNKILNRDAPETLVKKAPARQASVPETEQIRLAPFYFTDLPIGNKDDSQDAAEFEPFIYRTMRQRDSAMTPLRFDQQLITMKDRNLIIDAICRFHYKLGKTTITFYRFVGIFDRYLSAEPVTQQKLKVFACAAFLIASKIEDVQPVEASDLVHISERAFSVADLLVAERQILNAIQFATTFATPLFYLTLLMRIDGGTQVELLQGRYIIELCQTHEKFFGVAPSLVACTAIYVVPALQGTPHWPPEIAGYTQYTEDELKPWASVVYQMLREPDREESRFIRRKYGSDLFLYAAMVAVPPELN
jgi:G2/mitotic-specific cyclin 1/2